MASSYGVIKNNVQNFLKNTKEYDYSPVTDKVAFMENNYNVPGQFYELISFGNIKHMVHNKELVMGFCIDSRQREPDALGVFAYTFYDGKIYSSDRLDFKTFNSSTRKFNWRFKAYCGFSEKKAFEYFIECFGCVNDQDKDVKDIIIGDICEEVTDILNDIHWKYIEYLTDKKNTTDSKIEVRRRIRNTEERKRVEELENLLEEAKRNLNRKESEISNEENLQILNAKAIASKSEYDYLLTCYNDTLKYHTTLKPIPNSMRHNIESGFSRTLDNIRGKARQKYNEKSEN